MSALRRYAPIADRLAALTDKSGDCWLWMGARSAGYGMVSLRAPRRTVRAHRLAWELEFGPIPDGLMVCHHCDNKLCVRPAHLFLGTNRDNQLDALAKGRLAVGERNAIAKLTLAQVGEIKARLAAGEGPTALAAQYGVSRPAIQAIKQGRNWRAAS